MGFTTDPSETPCVRCSNGFERLAHSGAYVAKSEADWVASDAKDTRAPRTTALESGLVWLRQPSIGMTRRATECLDIGGKARFTPLACIFPVSIPFEAALRASSERGDFFR